MAVAYTDIELNTDDLPTLNKVKKLAHKAAFNLLFELDKNVNKKEKEWSNIHTICTSESLTAGMILSTLVDIPWGGLHKYGGFGVYDTDAKRVFNKVSVDNVYTHRCAKEMAVGILKNSNATLALSVTGNAMPAPEDLNLLGEVFIGVAGYITEYDKTKIIYQTMMMNACDNDIEEFKNTCTVWHQTLKNQIKNVWNPRSKTALISQEIRNYTTYKALEFCLEFVRANNIVVPQFVVDRKALNNIIDGSKSHINIPENKYNDYIEEAPVGIYYDVLTSNRINTAQYDEIVKSVKSGGDRVKPNTKSIYTITPKTPPNYTISTIPDRSKRSYRTLKSIRKLKSRRSRRSSKH